MSLEDGDLHKAKKLDGEVPAPSVCTVYKDRVAVHSLIQYGLSRFSGTPANKTAFAQPNRKLNEE